MANIYNLVSTERDLITQFASDFSTKQSNIMSDVSILQAQIDVAVQAENDETATLCLIQSQLDGLSLSNTLASLSAVDADLNSKFSAYTALVQNNNIVATDIYSKLQASAGLIANVQSTMAGLKNSISSMSATLAQYSNRPVASNTGPVVIAAPAPVEEAATVPVVEEVAPEPVVEEAAPVPVVEKVAPVVEEVAPVVEEEPVVAEEVVPEEAESA